MQNIKLFLYVCVCARKISSLNTKGHEKGVAERKEMDESHALASQSPGDPVLVQRHQPRSESERSEEMVDPMLSIRIRSIS